MRSYRLPTSITIKKKNNGKLRQDDQMHLRFFAQEKCESKTKTVDKDIIKKCHVERAGRVF